MTTLQVQTQHQARPARHKLSVSLARSEWDVTRSAKIALPDLCRRTGRQAADPYAGR